MRSKRGRKLRAFKRIRYGEKELLRLKNMLTNAEEEEKRLVSATPVVAEKLSNEENGQVPGELFFVYTGIILISMNKLKKNCWRRG